MVKIIVKLNGLTNRRARRLAAEKETDFQKYLQKTLEESAAAQRRLIEDELCEVTLEIDEETMSDLQLVSERLISGAWGDYTKAVASGILVKEIETEWGRRG